MVELRKTVEVPDISIRERIEVSSRDSAVIVVDMQNDFAHRDGKLFVPSAPDTIPAIKRLIDKARGSGVPVIYTQDWHQREDPEFRIWGEHAVENTWGSEIVEELKPREGDIVIRKLRYDGFYGTSLEHILSHVLKRNTLVITGTVANICVLHTAGSAALRWFNIVVPMDGISALNEFDYLAALRQIDFLYKGTIVKSVDGIYFR